MTDVERDDLGPLAQRLVREIHDISGLTYEEISGQFALCPTATRMDITENYLRKLASGRPHVSFKQLKLIAKSAKACGWEGPISRQLPQIEEMFKLTLTETDVFVSELKKVFESDFQAKNKAVLNFNKALVDLAALGWEQHELAHLSQIMIEELFLESKKK